MPAQTRKKPVEAAADEAVGDGDVTVEFRSQKFTVKGDTRRSVQFALALASRQDHVLLYQMLGPIDSDRFIRLCSPGESFTTVAAEFFESYERASGQGNS